MAFIVKGGMKEISKKEMKAHLEELDKIEDPMSGLSDERNL